MRHPLMVHLFCYVSSIFSQSYFRSCVAYDNKIKDAQLGLGHLFKFWSLLFDLYVLRECYSDCFIDNDWTLD